MGVICNSIKGCIFPDLTNTADPHKGDALIGFKQPYAGAIPRTVHDKLREIVSVRDFGAKGDGLTDGTAAIQATIDALDTPGGTICIPPGIYRIGNDITFPAHVRCVFEKGGVLLIDPNVTVTINGSLEAGPYQWVDLSAGGSVVFGQGAVECILGEWFGAKGDGAIANASANVTAWRAAANAVPSGGGKLCPLPGAHYQLNDEIPLTVDGTHVEGPGWNCRFTQTAADRTIFNVTQKDRIWISNVRLYGEGSWSAAWTGMEGHDDRGIQFLACARSGCTKVLIQNMANAGIAVLGGSRITIAHPVIEGTHEHSTPLPSQANFQAGIFVLHDSNFGSYEDVTIIAPDISGTAQGILTGMKTSNPGVLNIYNPNIHDIPGQHGIYLDSGKVNIVGPTIDNTELTGIKIQSGKSFNHDLEAISITGFNITNTGSQAFEIAVVCAGSISGLVISGGVIQACQRGLAIDGKVRDSVFSDIVIRDIAQHGILLQDADADNLEFNHLSIRNTKQHGVIVNAKNGKRLRFNDIQIMNPNTSAGAFYGFSAVAGEVKITNLEIIEENANMAYGLFVNGAELRVYGRIKISGATSQSVRADTTIYEWPAGAEVGLSNPVAYLNVNNIRFSGQTEWARQTTSASNLAIWAQTLEDESAYMIRAEIVGKHTGSTERGAFVSTVLCYRDAGGVATIQGSADQEVNITSGSFAGVYTWAVSGNDIRLLANSGGDTVIDWKARINLTRVAG